MRHKGWIPAATPPALEDGWVLIVIDFHEICARPAVRLGYYDAVDGWRTQVGRIRSEWEVTHWQPLPELPEIHPLVDEGLASFYTPPRRQGQKGLI